jgi:hypothetical protein
MAEVSVRTIWRIGGGSRKGTSCFQVRAFCKGTPFDPDTVAQEVASIVLRDYPEAEDMDLIAVYINYGYDIGIASGWKSLLFSHSPSEWRDLLAEISGSP